VLVPFTSRDNVRIALLAEEVFGVCAYSIVHLQDNTYFATTLAMVVGLTALMKRFIFLMKV